MPIYDDFVGTLEGSVNASIRARVQGYLNSQNYKEGGEVKKGDLLFQIDPRPFEAALAQAKAALAQAEANAQQAEMIARRNLDLFSRRTISEQERDTAVQQDDSREGKRGGAKCRDGASATERGITPPSNRRWTALPAWRGPSSATWLARQGVLTTVTTVDPIKALFTVSDRRKAKSELIAR